jgi:hypothetical protein
MVGNIAQRYASETRLVLDQLEGLSELNARVADVLKEQLGIPCSTKGF